MGLKKSTKSLIASGREYIGKSDARRLSHASYLRNARKTLGSRLVANSAIEGAKALKEFRKTRRRLGI